MTELQAELDKAFSVLSAIPVAGENVDRMMIVRECLRKAYQLAGRQDNDKNSASAEEV